MRTRNLIVTLIAVSFLYLAGYFVPTISSLCSFLASGLIIIYVISHFRSTRPS